MREGQSQEKEPKEKALETLREYVELIKGVKNDDEILYRIALILKLHDSEELLRMEGNEMYVSQRQAEMVKKELNELRDQIGLNAKEDIRNTGLDDVIDELIKPKDQN